MVDRQGGKYAILGMLSLRPMSGYDIRKTVQQSISHFWSESYGQIYPALKQLQSQKLVKRVRGVQQGRPARQVFTLTPAGRRALRQWLVNRPQWRPFRNELLLKLFFGRLAPTAACVEHVQQFRQRQDDLLGTYRQLEAWLQSEHNDHPDLPFWSMTLSYGLHEARALRAWCDETLAALSGTARKTTTRNRQ